MSENSARKSGRKRKVNRAQKKAIEVRAAETQAVVETTATPVRPGSGTGRSSIRTERRFGRASELGTKSVAITRKQEYAYIRSDLKRLTYVASSLFVVMIGLLFILD